MREVPIYKFKTECLLLWEQVRRTRKPIRDHSVRQAHQLKLFPLLCYKPQSLDRFDETFARDPRRHHVSL
jgi:hypothetical protein